MYIINVTEVDTGAQFQYTSVNTQYTLRSLHPYYTYEFVIEAITIAPGPPTSAFRVQTNQDGKFHIPCIVCENMFLAEVLQVLYSSFCIVISHMLVSLSHGRGAVHALYKAQLCGGLKTCECYS